MNRSERRKENRAEEVREARYREEHRNNQKDRETLTQLLSTIIPVKIEFNQTIPQSIHFSGKSVPNISTITADESNRQMIVSPVSTTYAPHRITITTN